MGEHGSTGSQGQDGIPGQDGQRGEEGDLVGFIFDLTVPSILLC